MAKKIGTNFFMIISLKLKIELLVELLLQKSIIHQTEKEVVLQYNYCIVQAYLNEVHHSLYFSFRLTNGNLRDDVGKEKLQKGVINLSNAFHPKATITIFGRSSDFPDSQHLPAYLSF